MADDKDKKPKSIKDVLAATFKKYDLHVGPLSSVAEDVEAYETGNIAIDHIIGVGGLPMGRSIELFGPPSSGKTTTALQTAATLQKLIIAGGNDDPAKGPIVAGDDVIAYFDYEHAMDPAYCKKLGLDTDHESFLFAQPESLEQGANVFRALLETDKVRMGIFDSVASMIPSAKAEAEIGKSLPAVQAKLMSDFLGPLNALLHEHRCTAVFVNHEMELMDMGGGRRPGMAPRTSTPGGRALKFYASVRIKYQQIGNIKIKALDPLSNEEIERVDATNVKVQVIKNKVAPPFRQAVVRVRYGRGFDNFWTALQILIAHKKVVYSSGYFYFEKAESLIHPEMSRTATKTQRPYIKGEETLFEFADNHPDWREKAIALATSVVDEDISALDAITPERPVEDDPEQEEVPEGVVNTATGEIEAPVTESGKQIQALIDEGIVETIRSAEVEAPEPVKAKRKRVEGLVDSGPAEAEKPVDQVHTKAEIAKALAAKAATNATTEALLADV